MVKKNCDQEQLSLEFNAAENFNSAERKAAIIQFIDGPTRRLRAEAIHRVATSGIFEPSAKYRSR